MNQQLAVELQTAKAERERHRRLVAEHRDAHQETWSILQSLKHHLGRLNCFSHNPPVPVHGGASPTADTASGAAKQH